MISDPLPFDIYGELPGGTTVLEASAGTGKTYTVAALTARVIANRANRASGADSAPSGLMGKVSRAGAWSRVLLKN